MTRIYPKLISTVFLASYAVFASGLAATLHASQCVTGTHTHGSHSHAHHDHSHNHSHDQSEDSGTPGPDCPTCYQITSASTAVIASSLPAFWLEPRPTQRTASLCEAIPGVRLASPLSPRAPPAV